MLLLLIVTGILQDENRTFLRLKISFGQILPYNSGTEKLYSADHENNTGKGRPAGYRIAPDQRPHHDYCDHNKGKQTEKYT